MTHRRVTIPNSEQRTLTDARTGVDYEILIALPETPPPPTGFPVVYLLDADTMFATVAEAVRIRSRRMSATGVMAAVVVGIGYGGTDASSRARRRVDLSPSSIEGERMGLQVFIEKQVKGFVESRVPIDRMRQTLLGHSLGGAFVLNAFFSDPTAFDTYVSLSPSIWTARGGLMRQAGERSSSLSGPPRRLMIAVGELEQAMAPWQLAATDAEAMRTRRAERRMVDSARSFAKRLRNANRGLVIVRFHELAGEDHASVVAASLTPALRLALGPR